MEVTTHRGREAWRMAMVVEVKKLLVAMWLEA
jgi:hypothetical protein